MKNGDGHGAVGLLTLALLALVAGALAGLVGAIFRLCLDQADHLRGDRLGYILGDIETDRRNRLDR